MTSISTPRSITKLDIEFTAAAGYTLATTKLSVPLDAESLNWFSSASSQGFGGIFKMVIPLVLTNLNTDNPAPVSLLSSIATIKLTLSNQIGASSQFTINLSPQ
jgi:hypothetical protein